MSKITVFSGITRSDLAKLKACIGCEEKYYMQGEEIYSCDSERILKVGTLTDGRATVQYYSHGRLYEKLRIKSGDAFGELFSLPPQGHSVKIYAGTDCSVLFFDYSALLRPCERACYYHFTVLSNLFKMLCAEATGQNLRLSLLKEKNAKEKILSFLENERISKGSSSFELHLSQAELSDYLCLDRSSLARAISELRRDGIINSRGKHFELLP